MIPVLFARRDSIYKTLPECDVYDQERNALTYSGKSAIIAHPPCRLWGNLSHFSTAPKEEKELAIFAIYQIREKGGIAEHPRGSKLWRACQIPLPGQAVDRWGGYTIEIKQFWFGHRADKATWLYIRGCSKRELPPIPLVMGEAPCVVDSSSNNKIKRGGRRKTITKPEREHTPELLAVWLCKIISIIERNKHEKNDNTTACIKRINHRRYT